ncbi:PepSY domain-containing protein [Aquimarina hainanensis]|uniref:PepSY domain-containing protein n=1 Tax=Aquimarina hainanensis TaxID=1578017 RepID=A0ABW5N636_9FLAO
MIAKLYKWHKKLGLWVLIPMILWTISGVLHPIMGWIKPDIANRRVHTIPITKETDSSLISTILTKNQLPEIKNIRMVSMLNKQYYQVEKPDNTLAYIETQTHIPLTHGDQQYAKVLARHFSGEQELPISEITLLHNFTNTYREINRLLPVYKVRFENGKDVYVHTPSSRLGTINDRTRIIMLYAFNMMHNWDFIWFSKAVKLTLIIVLALLSLLTALSGVIFYTAFWKKYKRTIATSRQSKFRKYHRITGMTISIFMMLFAFSGLYHAFVKFDMVSGPAKRYSKVYDSKTLQFSLTDIVEKNSHTPVNFRLTSFDQQNFIQVFSAKKKVAYLHLNTRSIEKDGNAKHAFFLADYFSGLKDAKKNTPQKIARFSGEYGFINKRLPVWKIAYKTVQKDTYYVETTTDRLASKVDAPARREGFSFAFLHKYHYLDFLGKDTRNGIMIVITLMVAIVSILGLSIYYQKNEKKKTRKKYA